MGFFKKYMNQTRKPEGFLGSMMVNGMNGGHAKLADWGIDYLMKEGISPSEMLEIGCGGGRNAGELMNRFPQGKMTAIDYSPVSVDKTKEYNSAKIKAGICTVQSGDVSALDFDEGRFDLATAFETIYFWPGLEKCFSQVAKVLKSGAKFMIVNESDGKDATSLKFEKIINGMKCYTAQDIEENLKKAGFSDVKSFHHDEKPWITVIATK